MNNPGNSPTAMCIWTTVIDSIGCEKTKDEVVMENNVFERENWNKHDHTS